MGERIIRHKSTCPSLVTINGLETTQGLLDKYALYVHFFQQPEEDIQFIDATYRQLYGRAPESMREDFCGTAANCIAWVKSQPSRIALGVDIDRASLEWCREHLIEDLSPEIASGISLVNEDALLAEHATTDVIWAGNCSLFALKSREELTRYLVRTRRRLNSDGLFVCDVYCGPDSLSLGCDRYSSGRFTAVWEQAEIDHLTNGCKNYIHFYSDEGAACEKAFSYDYRLWSPAEIIEALGEAGFAGTQAFLRHSESTRQTSMSREIVRALTTRTHATVDIVAYT